MKMFNLISPILLLIFISLSFLFSKDFIDTFSSVLSICGIFICAYCFYNCTFFSMNFQTRKYLYEFQYKIAFSIGFHSFYFCCFCGGFFFLFSDIGDYLTNGDLTQVYSNPWFYISVFSISVVSYLTAATLLNRAAMKPSTENSGTDNEEVNS